MAETPRPQMTPQRWRLEIGRTGQSCKIFVNDEQWFTVHRLRLSCGANEVTKLELELYPTEVQVLLNEVEITIAEANLFGERHP